MAEVPTDEDDRWNELFRQLWARSRPRLLVVARGMTGSAADAEDVLQEAFCAAWRHRASFLGAARPTTWLHRITVNAALMHLRSRRRRRTESLDGRPLPSSLVGDDDPLVAALQQERERAFAAALDRLPGPDRTLLLATDADDPQGGAGSTTRSAWKSRRFRARRHLREDLFAHGALP
jgi:RNA polymerase sigma-70 factor (ECF subfamily)